jgi:hypothetical protein
MKQINVKSITAFVTVLIFSITAFVSCTKYTTKKNGTIIEPCKNVVCYNGGTCFDGVCKCPAGFGGLDCSDKWNDAYTGTYEANDQCDITNKYLVSIGNGAGNADQIVVTGIGTFCPGVVLQGVIRPEKSSVDFVKQRFCDSLYISGTATQSQDKSFINVWLDSRDSNNHTSSDCSIVLRKL